MKKSPACLAILTAACVFGQIPEAARFDAASVKPSGRDTKGSGVRFLPGGRVEARNASLMAILVQAYDVTELRIAGAPEWVSDAKTARFDIEAAAPAGNTETPRLRLMLQALLAERFQLQVHRETRSVPVYALLPDKNGPHLKPVADVDKVRGTPAFDSNMYGGHVDGTDARMPDFVRVLERWLDRPVLDKTGFADAFSVTLSWAPGPENTRNALPFAPNPDDPQPSIFTAVQDQLGLRLNAERDPLEVIVIDRVERPSPN